VQRRSLVGYLPSYLPIEGKPRPFDQQTGHSEGVQTIHFSSGGRMSKKSKKSKRSSLVPHTCRPGPVAGVVRPAGLVEGAVVDRHLHRALGRARTGATRGDALETVIAGAVREARCADGADVEAGIHLADGAGAQQALTAGAVDEACAPELTGRDGVILFADARVAEKARIAGAVLVAHTTHHAGPRSAVHFADVGDADEVGRVAGTGTVAGTTKGSDIDTVIRNADSAVTDETRVAGAVAMANTTKRALIWRLHTYVGGAVILAD
jgi:hypothetical protein